MSIASDNKLKSLKRHQEYFHEGGDLIVIIGDISFRVASSFFTRESPIFRERLEPKTNGSDTPSTRTPINTIVIQPEENVSADDFAKLCWVFYNKEFSIYEAPLSTWETILRLANQYQFPEVKDLAFRQLSTSGKFDLPLVDRIVLYKKYAADFKYLEPLYIEALSRAEPLTLDEGNVLGMTTTLIISGAREYLRAASDKLASSAPLPDSMNNAVIEMVRAVLASGPLPDLGRSSTGPAVNSSLAPPGPNGLGTSTSSVRPSSDNLHPMPGGLSGGKKHKLGRTGC